MWGWSRNGKAAYTVEKEDSGRGGYITEAVLLDVIDNVVLWKQEIDSIDITGTKETKAADYNRFYRDFRRICVKNGIEFAQVYIPVSEGHESSKIDPVVHEKRPTLPKK
jgi:hypothetical protein